MSIFGGLIILLISLSVSAFVTVPAAAVAAPVALTPSRLCASCKISCHTYFDNKLNLNLILLNQ